MKKIILLACWLLLLNNTSKAEITFENIKQLDPEMLNSVKKINLLLITRAFKTEYTYWNSGVGKEITVKTDPILLDIGLSRNFENPENAKLLQQYAKDKSLKEYFDSIKQNTELKNHLLSSYFHQYMDLKYKILPFYHSGYYFYTTSNFKGKRPEKEYPFNFVAYEHSKDKKEFVSKYTPLYKIHLMPKKSKLYNVIIKFFDKINNNQDLQKVINNFKVYYKIDDANLKEPWHKIMPRVVIYPAEGKENTQKALNIIYDIYKDMPNAGVDVAPRFNEKITNLIYVAQGDGDAKKQFVKEDGNIKEDAWNFFEKPNMAYYAPNLSGENQNYHLDNPAQAKAERQAKEEAEQEAREKTKREKSKPANLQSSLTILNSALTELSQALKTIK